MLFGPIRRRTGEAQRSARYPSHLFYPSGVASKKESSIKQNSLHGNIFPSNSKAAK
jgi:hypothetical protein